MHPDALNQRNSYAAESKSIGAESDQKPVSSSVVPLIALGSRRSGTSLPAGFSGT